MLPVIVIAQHFRIPLLFELKMDTSPAATAHESGPKISITELTSEHIKFILYNCDLR